MRTIWRYIAAEDPSAADRLLRRINQKLQILRGFPDIGSRRDDIRPGFRMLVEGNYLMLYEHSSERDTVTVVVVVDGRRELAELF